MPQFGQAEAFFGFFAWCDLREFFFAFDVRLRGTAMMISPINPKRGNGPLSRLFLFPYSRA